MRFFRHVQTETLQNAFLKTPVSPKYACNWVIVQVNVRACTSSQREQFEMKER